MRICSPHAEDDSAAPRSRRPSPQAQGPRGARGPLALGLSPAGGAPDGRAPDSGRAPAAARSAVARRDAGVHGQGREGGARQPVIVVDASAVLEVLLNTPDGAGIAARLF